MPGDPRLILFANASASIRLREDSGCRAFRDGSVRFVPIEPFLGGEATAAVSPNDLRAMLETLAARRGTPLCLLWTSDAPGRTALILDMLRNLDRRLERDLQHDRHPLPWSAVVVVAPHGLDRADEDALRTLADERTEGRDPALPLRLPIYLVIGGFRVDVEGRMWSSAEVWPVAVGRLLASVALAPKRTPGLRAFRAFGIDAIGHGIDAIDAESLRLLNDALAPDAEAARVAAGEIRIHGTPHRPPSDRVDEGGCPNHAYDEGTDDPHERPRLPAFTELEPCTAVGGESEDVGEIAGGTSRETELRTSERPGSPWHVRFTGRGRRFLEDRGRRIAVADRAFVGPRGIIADVWRNIHESARNLRWYAHGGFFASPDEPEFERLSRQMRRWEEIRRADRHAAASTRAARVAAAELDLARSHFVSIWWRIACMAAAVSFTVAALSIPARAWGGRFVVIVALAAGLSAGLAMLVVLYLELRAGERGRRGVEGTIRRAEHAISDSFRRRVILGADGELLQRSTGWLQGAARVRDAARRLLELRERSIVGLSRSDASPHRARHAEDIDAYRIATTLDADFGITPFEAADRRRQEDPSFVPTRREFLAHRWQSLLRNLDPSEVGGIAASEFVPRITADLEEVRDSFRTALLEECERSAPERWLERSDSAFARLFGLGTDLPGLSVPTLRARGDELVRVTRIVAPSEATARRVAETVRVASHGSCRPVTACDRVDPWGAFALVIDEIAVRFPERSDRPETTVSRLLEGIEPPKRSRKETDSGDAP